MIQAKSDEALDDGLWEGVGVSKVSWNFQKLCRPQKQRLKNDQMLKCLESLHYTD